MEPERDITWYGITDGAASPDSPYGISGHAISSSRSLGTGLSASSGSYTAPPAAPQPAHPDQERRYRAATNRNVPRGSLSRTWVKSSELKKPARKKREQERSTTRSRGRVRIRPDV